MSKTPVYSVFTFKMYQGLIQEQNMIVEIAGFYFPMSLVQAVQKTNTHFVEGKEYQEYTIHLPSVAIYVQYDNAVTYPFDDFLNKFNDCWNPQPPQKSIGFKDDIMLFRNGGNNVVELNPPTN